MGNCQQMPEISNHDPSDFLSQDDGESQLRPRPRLDEMSPSEDSTLVPSPGRTATRYEAYIRIGSLLVGMTMRDMYEYYCTRYVGM